MKAIWFVMAALLAMAVQSAVVEWFKISVF